ncbi:metallophosphoesterase family protein [Kiloniella laminariae]|uniref:Metallophosphoesterase family protein n=1 Tax=Kiloniella laminariae TaxID=454162 RepID=A0ABT4LNB5_9PROT|nr:metallophosphoesterase family protein [Kiloniella laminariae]MCZ4282598.1 metallophosphoesterase family protein [Kiloniella laminariae]
MQVAIISDIHGNLLALETVMREINQRKPDFVLNLGDCVSGPFWPKETFEYLQDLDIPTVRGNHDRWLDERTAEQINPGYDFGHRSLDAGHRKILGALPARLMIEQDILAFHGTPLDDTKYLLEDNVEGRLALARGRDVHARIGDQFNASLYLCGHSHLAHIATGPKGSTIINPGSVGCPRYADSDAPLEAESGSAHARFAIATKTEKRWSVELIALDYDWGKVAARARENGYPSWAQVY